MFFAGEERCSYHNHFNIDKAKKLRRLFLLIKITLYNNWKEKTIKNNYENIEKKI